MCSGKYYMKRSAILYIAVLLLSPINKLNAQSASNAASFLEIDAGARGAAMGGAFTAIGDDASSMFYNPAGPALARNQEVMLSHSQWLGGLWNDQIAYLQPVSDKLTIFTGVAALAGPPIEKYDIAGNKTGSFVAFDGAFGVGSAWTLGDDLYGGLNFKAICQQVDNVRAFAYAGDAGFIKNFKTLRIGAAVQNVGTQMKLYQESFDLPLTYRGGAAFRIREIFWLSGEAIKIGAAETFFAGGAEGEFNLTKEYVGYLRAGYKSGRSKNTGPGISGGIGIRSGSLYADYAFSPFGDLGDTHRLTLGVKFGNDRSDINPKKDKRLTSSENKPAQEPEVEAVEPELPSTNAVDAVVPEPEVVKTYQDYLESADNYISKKDYRNAAIEYAKAQKVLPENDRRKVYTFEQQGQMSLKMKNIAKAKDCYLAAILTAKKLNMPDAKVINAYLGLAYCFERTGNTDTAIKNYEKALKISKNNTTKIRIKKILQKLKTQSQ